MYDIPKAQLDLPVALLDARVTSLLRGMLHFSLHLTALYCYIDRRLLIKAIGRHRGHSVNWETFSKSTQHSLASLYYYFRCVYTRSRRPFRNRDLTIDNFEIDKTH